MESSGPIRNRPNGKKDRYLDVDLLFNTTLLISKRNSCSTNLLSIARTLSRPDFFRSVVLIKTVYPHLPGTHAHMVLKVKTCLDSLTENISGDEPEKFIIIYEADQLGEKLQHVLEYFISVSDRYNVTFILAFSSISRFNYSLSSRFSKFCFKALEQNELKDIISHICKEQSSRLDDKYLTTISHVSNGSLRTAIKCCEEAESNNVNVCGISCELENAEAFIRICMCDGESLGTAESSKLKSLLNTILKEEGNDMSMFLNGVLDAAIKQIDMPNRVEIFKCVVEADQNIQDYDGDRLEDHVYVYSQLLELFFSIRKALSNSTASDANEVPAVGEN